MSEKPWREQGWDEWCELWDCAIPNDRVDFARFREATDEKRAELDAGWQISVKATEKAIDALCARVWREAQRITWQAWQKQHDENGCERAEAAEARADRLAVALREYGEDDGFGRWHEFGCVEDFTDFKTGEPLSRCSRARAALADSPKEENDEHSLA